MSNARLAEALSELADYMALDGGDTHRIAHYRGTSTAIRRFEHSIADMVKGGIDLTRVPGIGKGLAGFLEELIRSGRSERLAAFRERIPSGLPAVMHLEGVGATRARTLWREAGIESLEELEAALEGRSILALEGFGPGVVSRIRRGLSALKKLDGRFLLLDGDRAVEELASFLDGEGVAWARAGEVHRRIETISVVDVVVGVEPEALWGMVEGSSFRPPAPKGSNPLALESKAGPPVRLTAVHPSQVEAVAHHLTGPPEFLEALGDEAGRQGLSLTPLGLVHGDLQITSVPGLYETLGLPLVPPELRVDGSSLARASRSGIPRLVEASDIRGDLHVHTTWSDGAATLERVVEEAAARGYEYVAITDHSPSTGVVTGLDGDDLAEQRDEIARVQELFPETRVLTGIEVDILPDGSLDLEDDVLLSLDLVVASVHSAFEQDEATMTRRIIRAMENPAVQVLGHLTGRKLGRRLGYSVDLAAVLEAAAETDVAIEVNGSPRRLDLDWRGLWQCRERGVNVVVTSDAHSIARLDNVRHAVDQARRGWLETRHVANTKGLSDMLSWIRRRCD
ncbi:MAG: PHP domain-containing protein [Gemmatimonadetes bacterium]|nr:PHP domain-containing protein [Gemmatimonadota bacterium]